MSPARTKAEGRLSRSGAMSTMMRPGIRHPTESRRPRRRLAKSHPRGTQHRPVAGREGGAEGRAQLAETGGGARRAPPRGASSPWSPTRNFGTACHRRAWVIRSGERVARVRLQQKRHRRPGAGTRARSPSPALADAPSTATTSPRHHVAQGHGRARCAGRGAGSTGRAGHRPDARTCPVARKRSRSGPAEVGGGAVSDHRGGRMEDSTCIRTPGRWHSLAAPKRAGCDRSVQDGEQHEDTC